MLYGQLRESTWYSPKWLQCRVSQLGGVRRSVTGLSTLLFLFLDLSMNNRQVTTEEDEGSHCPDASSGYIYLNLGPVDRDGGVHCRGDLSTTTSTSPYSDPNQASERETVGCLSVQGSLLPSCASTPSTTNSTVYHVCSVSRFITHVSDLCTNVSQGKRGKRIKNRYLSKKYGSF
jgi:hypothetical protein